MQIEIVRSKKRKNLMISVARTGVVTVKAPYNMPEATIFKFINEKQDWILKSIELQRQRADKYPEPTTEEIKVLKQKAKEILPLRVDFYGNLMGVKPTSLKITSAKGRFGSCSGKNGICFSYRLMMYPEEAIDYVVVHELAHIKHHNHSKQFWTFVEKFMPDYKERRRLLK